MAPVKQVPFEEELRKNPELKESDIQMLREWSSKQPHLPKMTDSDLALFLHSNYYRMEPTKTTIDTYYTVRTHVPEFFANRDALGAKELRTAFKTTIYMPLEQHTKEGYKVFYGKLLDFDPSNYNYNDCMKYMLMTVDLWLNNEGTGPGHILLINVQGVALGHVGRLSPMGLKKFLYYLQEALPVRLKSVHFMNTVPVMDMILAMMKPFMKKELIDMLHIHSSLETVSKFVPLDALPNEDGGKAGTLADLAAKNIKWLEDNRDWFLEEAATMRVNESLRPGKGKSATDLFGVEGSFKKLDID